jgi:hypothetical protein
MEMVMLSGGPESMPGANRHYISRHVWHIKYRCHKKEFLLKFAKDYQGWLDWLFEAKKRITRIYIVEIQGG